MEFGRFSVNPLPGQTGSRCGQLIKERYTFRQCALARISATTHAGCDLFDEHCACAPQHFEPSSVFQI